MKRYERKTIRDNGCIIEENKGMKLGREILIPIKDNPKNTKNKLGIIQTDGEMFCREKIIIKDNSEEHHE